jgi:hypothetical protein
MSTISNGKLFSPSPAETTTRSPRMRMASRTVGQRRDTYFLEEDYADTVNVLGELLYFYLITVNRVCLN